MSSYLAYFFWDPDPDLFIIPFINHPIRWYGLCFVIGFMVAYRIIARVLEQRLCGNPLFTPEQIVNETAANESVENGPASYLPKGKCLLDRLNAAIEKGSNRYERRRTLEAQLGDSVMTLRRIAERLTDRLAWFIVAGMIIGARLGHCFFYDWERFAADPWKIPKVWEGGLASHGGAIGIILALLLFRFLSRRDYPWLTIGVLLDTVVIPTGFVGFCIRIGNFINQEILGTQTALPWAIIFGHPADGSLPTPRHPVQLYEALAYLAIFVVIWRLWKQKPWRPGFLTGLFFLLTFSLRVVAEMVKLPQEAVQADSAFVMGQWLSLPFIVIGVLMMLPWHKAPQEAT